MTAHIDIPTRAELERLLEWRRPGSISIYLPTSPDGQRRDAERIELDNLAADALDQIGEAGEILDRHELPALSESLADLVDDDEFWRAQARTLVVFAHPDGLRTFRLANELTAMVEVSDRFLVKPLLRAVTFPQTAFVLALAQGSVRLLEVAADLPPEVVEVPGMPTDVASAVGKSSIRDRSADRRVQGSEGQKLRMRQYARQIDQALRLVLGGHETPLVLAGVDPLLTIFRSVSSYPHLLDAHLAGNPESTSDADLADAVRPVLDEHYAGEMRTLRERFAALQARDLAVSDLADAARAATIGAVDTLLVDIDASVPGTVDEQTGAIRRAAGDDATTYGVIDEVARRVLASSGRVLALRTADIPGANGVAALLRYPLV